MLLEYLTIVKEFELIIRKKKSMNNDAKSIYINSFSIKKALRISYDDNIIKIVDIYILNNLKPNIGMLSKFIEIFILNPLNSYYITSTYALS